MSWGLLGCSWGLLGGSWGHLGPKRAPRAKNSSKTRFALPPWTPQVGPKNRQKSILRPSKRDHFFDDLLGGVLMPFCANLAPTWRPKPSQNRAKLGPSWTQVGTKCHQNRTQQTIKKIITFWKPSGTILGGFWLPSWRGQGGSESLLFGGFLVLGAILAPRRPQDAPRSPKRRPRQPPRPILEPFWSIFG